MMMRLFAIFLLAHLLADFTFQPDRLINLKTFTIKKRNFWNKGIFIHTCIHLIGTTILMAIFTKLRLEFLAPVFLITLSHYLVDRFKLMWKSTQVWTFLLDQLLHTALIYLLLWAFNLVLAPNSLYVYLTNLVNHDISLSLESKIIMGIATIVCLIWVSGYLIRFILTQLKIGNFESYNAGKDSTKDKPLQSVNGDTKGNQDSKETRGDDDKTKSMRFGRYIGYIERAIIGFFMVFEIYAGLGLLGTLKTIARFKQLEDRENSEYFILGTLLSMFLGMLFGAILTWVINY